MDREKGIEEEARYRGKRTKSISKMKGDGEQSREDERGGPWIYILVSHLEPSAARLKFHRGRADVIKTNYAYGTVMPHHFIP